MHAGACAHVGTQSRTHKACVQVCVLPPQSTKMHVAEEDRLFDVCEHLSRP